MDNIPNKVTTFKELKLLTQNSNQYFNTLILILWIIGNVELRLKDLNYLQMLKTKNKILLAALISILKELEMCFVQPNFLCVLTESDNLPEKSKSNVS